MRKSFDAVDSVWGQIRHDGMNQVLVAIYLVLCALFINMKVSSTRPGDEQVSWLLALLPELLVLAVVVLGYFVKVIDWIVPLQSWPSMKAGETHIMRTPSAFVTALQFVMELPISILYVVMPFKGWFQRMNESCVTRNLRERAAKRLQPVR